MKTITCKSVWYFKQQTINLHLDLEIVVPIILQIAWITAKWSGDACPTNKAKNLIFQQLLKHILHNIYTTFYTTFFFETHYIHILALISCRLYIHYKTSNAICRTAIVRFRATDLTKKQIQIYLPMSVASSVVLVNYNFN